MEATKCAMPRGPGWYVFAVEGDTPRQLNESEDRIVNEFRFGAEKIAACSRVPSRSLDEFGAIQKFACFFAVAVAEFNELT